MVTLENVLNVIPALSVAIALVYYAMTINNQNKTRQAQLFMQLFSNYIKKDVLGIGQELLQMEWTDFEDFSRKYDSSVNLENFEKRYSYWSYFDGIGMLLKKGLVDREMIYYLTGGYEAYWHWEKFKDVIYETRVRLDHPDLLVMFEYLADETKKMRLRRQHTLEIPSNWGGLTPDT